MFPMHEQLKQLEKRAANKGMQPRHKHIMDNVRKIEAGVNELIAKQKARLAIEQVNAESFFASRGQEIPEVLKMAACFGANYEPPFIR